jgi:hypothetical protein
MWKVGVFCTGVVGLSNESEVVLLLLLLMALPV